MSYKVFTHDRGFIDSVMTGKEYVRHNESLLQVGFMAMDPKSGEVPRMDWRSRLQSILI